MTYMEDREIFEADLCKPPHLARMCEHAGRFTGRLTKVDRNSLLEMAWDYLWARRDSIHETNDILLTWIACLTAAARTRERWLQWSGISWRWVRSSQLGRT